ncbi:MAG TPA: diguanylate cyclase [Conexibacter sp.]|nr:diguanylate cyclase [Conexibacter sp.]
MSFRVRLTLFFVLIVVVPMIALGVVVARLLSTSEHAMVVAQNRASAAVVLGDYRRLASGATRNAVALGRDPALAAAVRTPTLGDDRARAAALAVRLGVARARLTAATGAVLADIGSPDAIAWGGVRIRSAGQGGRGGADTGRRIAGARFVTLEAAETTAARFARIASSGRGIHAVIVRGRVVLASTLPHPLTATDVAHLPGEAGPGSASRTVTLAHITYAAAAFTAPDFGGRGRITVVVLTDAPPAAIAATRKRTLAFALLALFLLLAFAGALLVSRQLHGQVARFLTAAKRIGSGDFSATVPVEGSDEFAQLGREFNTMSAELERRLDELAGERARLRESIERVGATFAANLDRAALLEIGMQTIVDAVEATCGRATVRVAGDGPLLEAARVGDFAGAEQAIADAEAQVRERGVPTGLTAAAEPAIAALAAPIAPHESGDETGLPRGIVAVARRGRPFSDAERELVASLARQTGISLENVDLHEQVKRQAVTDQLTGLSNRGRFQQVIAAEAAAARRFDQPLGLLMLDIDNFKRVNDTYGHQQGDLVLREVAAALRDCSREVDEPARYGGEELAVALQQTDLAGAEAIAERVRTAVEALELPRPDGDGIIRVTVSCGVAASADGDPVALVAAADAALYAAKHAGKNRTACAGELPLAVAPADGGSR